MTMSGARPLLFSRVQFDRDRDGMGEWVRDLFLDEQEGLKDDLARDSDIDTIRRQLSWSIDLLRDIETELLHQGPTRRMRLYRGGQAEWVQAVLREEQGNLYDDLGALRTAGKLEDHPEVEKTRRELLWSVNLLRDVDSALVSLVGPDEDPRG